MHPMLLGLSVMAAAVLQAGGQLWASGWPEMQAPASATGGGERDAIVVVAIESYAFVAPVPGARANAMAWYDYFVKTRKTPVGNVQLLRDTDAAAESIREAAARAAREAGKDGTLWFVFIGHGAPAKDGKDGVLVGVDAQQKANSLYARSIPQKELLALLKQSGAARINIILDACFSGRTPEGNALIPALQPLILANQSLAADPRIVLLTAAGSDQFAGPLPGSGRPAFSYLTLGALRGWGDSDHDGKITAGELHDYVAGSLRALLRDREQTPSLLGTSTALLATATGERGPDISGLVKEQASAALPQSSGGSGTPQENAPNSLVPRMKVLVLLSEVDRGTPRVDSVAARALQGRLKEKGFFVVSTKSLGQARVDQLRAILKRDAAGARKQLAGIADLVIWGEAETRPGDSGVRGMNSCIAESSAEILWPRKNGDREQTSLEPVKGFGVTKERACLAALKNAGADWGDQIAEIDGN